MHQEQFELDERISLQERAFTLASGGYLTLLEISGMTD